MALKLINQNTDIMPHFNPMFCSLISNTQMDNAISLQHSSPPSKKCEVKIANVPCFTNGKKNDRAQWEDTVLPHTSKYIQISLHPSLSLSLFCGYDWPPSSHLTTKSSASDANHNVHLYVYLIKDHKPTKREENDR